MALTLTEVQAITNDYVLKKKAEDIVFQDSVLLYMLMNDGKFQDNLVTAGELVDGGERIRVILEYAKSNGGTYGNTTKIPQAKVDILNAARFRWAGAFGSNAIDLDDRRQNSGDAAIVDLVHAKVNSIRKTIRDTLGDQVYAQAVNGDALLGLGDLFETTTSTPYGEIATDDMADWKANVITTSEDMSFKVMQAIRRTAKVGQNKSDKPNLYITTDLMKDAYERTLTPAVRYQDTKLANAGFDNVLFGGVPVVADDKQSAGILDALNTNYLNLKTHKDFAFTDIEWEGSRVQPDPWVANQRWSGQLVTSHRKAHCRHTNLTDPT